ncbi:MAG: alkaline phosphatase family protein [Nitrospirota bacterium]
MWWSRNRKKVMVIGLDSATPQLVFDQWLDRLPNIRSLIQRGAYGPMRSCDPPITVPAWSSMMSSKNPGRLGVYGFRNRADYSYDKLSIANSTAIKEDRVWDILSRAGKRVILIGVPQTYPPKPINGTMVTCFLTPDITRQYTHPPEFKKEVEQVVGEYLFDVKDFRSEQKDGTLEQIHEMTRKRFKLARYLLHKEDWDFFMMVEMGVDRIQHAFWKYMDKTHRKHSPGNPYENAIFEYYQYVDREMGELLSFADKNTTVFVVSDHGAKKMEGGICINEWLIRNGYLTLSEQPAAPMPLAKAKIDWGGTKAWGEGGYYSRLFLNVRGREPNGVVDPAQYEEVRDELIRKIEAIPDEMGRPIGTRVYRPEQLYPVRKAIAPDLVVYFGDLSWRSVGSVGLNVIHTFENDTGPDDANHAEHGILILAPPNGTLSSHRLDGLQLMDVAPTILRVMGLPVPSDMEGRIVSY